jgi:two-component system cell cycle response regulator
MEQENKIQSNKIKILVVEDDRVSRINLLTILQKNGYQILEAGNGNIALDIVKSNADIDTILLDREMPELDGIGFLKIVKNMPKAKKIPVIMITGHDKPEQIQEAIDHGVFYFLAKPVNAEVLNSVITAAIRESKQNKKLFSEVEKHWLSFTLIEKTSFKFHTIQHAEGLAGFIANIFPDPERVVTGIGELLINAVEHGRCKIGYELKGNLIKSGTLREEIERRSELPENKDHIIEAEVWKQEDGVYFKVVDQGDGFDWQQYMFLDASRARDNHGRGIAQANMVCFDKLVYNQKGNAVTAFSAFESKAISDW